MTEDTYQLQDVEIEIVNMLGQCMNMFARLPVVHPADYNEFALAIHAAQNIVFARPGMRQYGWPNLTKRTDAQVEK